VPAANGKWAAMEHSSSTKDISWPVIVADVLPVAPIAIYAPISHSTVSDIGHAEQTSCILRFYSHDLIFVSTPS
jgi:hypothetical protein